MELFIYYYRSQSGKYGGGGNLVKFFSFRDKKKSKKNPAGSLLVEEIPVLAVDEFFQVLTSR